MLCSDGYKVGCNRVHPEEVINNNPTLRPEVVYEVGEERSIQIRKMLNCMSREHPGEFAKGMSDVSCIKWKGVTYEVGRYFTLSSLGYAALGSQGGQKILRLSGLYVLHDLQSQFFIQAHLYEVQCVLV